MKTIILLLSIGVMILITACQPRTTFKKDDSAAADSILYFQPIDLDDAFLDTIFSEPDRALTLEKQLVPPPIPPKVPARFKEIEGFRVQIFAGIDSINALPLLDQVANLTTDSIYFFRENGLFKIQAGDYQFRYKADSAKTHFRQNGFPGAWVVQRLILIPAAPDSVSGFLAGPDTSDVLPLIGEETGRYKIQVMATADPEKARLTVAALRSRDNYNAFFEQNGNLYKIFVGFFTVENRAREVLQTLRNGDYPDAWLVY